MGSDKISGALREALLKRAVGYEYEERRVIAGKDGKPERVEVTRRHVPPDVRAIQRIQLMIELGEWIEEC